MLVGELVYQVLIVTKLSPFKEAFNYEPVELGPRRRAVLVGLKLIGYDYKSAVHALSSAALSLHWSKEAKKTLALSFAWPSLLTSSFPFQ